MGVLIIYSKNILTRIQHVLYNNSGRDDMTYNSREIIKILQADGWLLDRVKGSHHQFTHPIKSGTVTVPHPKKDLPPKTVKSILKQAGL